MQAAGILAALFLLGSFESLAFAGLWLALGAKRRSRRGRMLAAGYWLLSMLVLGAVVGAAVLGSRDADHAPQIPPAAVTAAAAVYLPKIVLAAAALLDLLLRAGGRLSRTLRDRPCTQPDGWLVRARVLPRLGLGFACLAFAAISWSATIGRSAVRVYRHTASLASLPAEFDGLRIVHLSDIHASSLEPGAARLADRLVAAVNAERPDLVIFSGDYGEAADFEAGPEILGRLRARLAKFAVLGNHDFGPRERAADNWTSADDKRRKIEGLSRAFGARGFTLLVNDAALLSRGAAAVAVIGVGVHDPHHGFADADLEAAGRSAGPAACRLLVAHSPEYWETAVRGRQPIALAFAGHTHGAQVGLGIGSLAWSPAALQYRRWGGLYREGRQYLNVNRGTGYVGLPFRLNMPADVSLLVLRSEDGGRQARRSGRAG